MLQIWTFRVSGRDRLHCTGCETRVARALQLLDGIDSVSASAATQRIAATGDPAQWDPEALRQQIVRVGYQVALDSAGETP